MFCGHLWRIVGESRYVDRYKGRMDCKEYIMGKSYVLGI